MPCFLPLRSGVYKKLRKSKTREKLKTQAFVKVNFTVPFNLLDLYDEEAERRGYTRSEALRQAMRRQLEMWTGRRL